MIAGHPIRVVHAFRTTDPATGGVAAYLASLRDALKSSAVEITVAEVFATDERRRIVAFAHPLRFRRLMASLLERADVLHVHGMFGWHVLLAVREARRRNVPYVLNTHGHLYPGALAQKPRRKGFYLSAIGRRLLERAAAVLVATDAEAETVRRQASNCSIELVPPGQLVPPTPRAAVHQAGAVSLPVRLLYLGRLHPHKNLEVLLRALAASLRQGLAAELCVAGDGEAAYVDFLRAESDRLGLTQLVRFVGYLGGAAKEMAFRNSAVFVLPSRSENFSFAVAEAMAEGIPAVVTNEVGLAALIRDCGCGSVVPVGDVTALSAALLPYADSELVRRQGRLAHATAQVELSLERMGHALERAYQAAIQTR